MTIKELSLRIHKNSTEKGFWVNDNFAEKLMLVVTELSEATEADRIGKTCSHDLAFDLLNCEDETFLKLFEQEIKGTVEDELADAVIRLMDICAYHRINLEAQVKVKMRYNKTREYLHGKKY